VGNLAKTYRRAHEVAAQPRFHEQLKSADDDPNYGPHFEDVAATRERMQAAGFEVGEARLHTVVPRFERDTTHDQPHHSQERKPPGLTSPAVLSRARPSSDLAAVAVAGTNGASETWFSSTVLPTTARPAR